MGKPVFEVSDKVWHKPCCIKPQRKLEISYLECGEIVLYLCTENKDVYQLRSYRTADLRLCFCICKKQVFSSCGSYDTSLVAIRLPLKSKRHFIDWCGQFQVDRAEIIGFVTC